VKVREREGPYGDTPEVRQRRCAPPRVRSTDQHEGTGPVAPRVRPHSRDGTHSFSQSHHTPSGWNPKVFLRVGEA